MHGLGRLQVRYKRPWNHMKLKLGAKFIPVCALFFCSYGDACGHCSHHVSQGHRKPQRTFDRSLQNPWKKVCVVSEERRPNKNGRGRVLCYRDIWLHGPGTSGRECEKQRWTELVASLLTTGMAGGCFTLCQDIRCFCFAGIIEVR